MISTYQYENGLCNGHGNEEAFPLPKLHQQQERKHPPEGSVPNTPPRSITPAAREPKSPNIGGSSRVSRLAAIYKGNGHQTILTLVDFHVAV